MLNQIELIEVIKFEEGLIVETQPHLFNLESIDRLTTATRYPGCCYIFPTGSQDRILIQGEYSVIKTLLEEARLYSPSKLCYVFQVSGVGNTSSHYVPSDTVGSILVNKGNNIVTLVLKTGEKLNTNLTMPELKKTLIEVNF